MEPLNHGFKTGLLRKHVFLAQTRNKVTCLEQIYFGLSGSNRVNRALRATRVDDTDGREGWGRKARKAVLPTNLTNQNECRRGRRGIRRTCARRGTAAGGAESCRLEGASAGHRLRSTASEDKCATRCNLGARGKAGKGRARLSDGCALPNKIALGSIHPGDARGIVSAAESVGDWALPAGWYGMRFQRARAPCAHSGRGVPPLFVVPASSPRSRVSNLRARRAGARSLENPRRGSVELRWRAGTSL